MVRNHAICHYVFNTCERALRRYITRMPAESYSLENHNFIKTYFYHANSKKKALNKGAFKTLLNVYDLFCKRRSFCNIFFVKIVNCSPKNASVGCQQNFEHNPYLLRKKHPFKVCILKH